MKVHADCRPCFIRQMESAARAAGADEAGVRRVSLMAREKLDAIWNECLSPPEISAPLYREAGRMCGKDDPFRAEKIHYTREALKYLPEVESLIRQAEDPFDRAVRVSVAGNIIDFGTGRGIEEFNIGDSLREYLEKPMLRDDTPDLKRLASRARTVLFIADNAGEAVFDRPLLSCLKSADRIFYITRDGPVINDVTLDDAVLAGVDHHAELISSGSRVPGIIPGDCSQQFRDLHENADLVIAKGQGNFETLTELPGDGRTFMLFIVKCAVAARGVGGEIGDMIVMRW